MDATRRCDGKHIMLKKIYPDEEPHELMITQLFSSPAIVQDPRNHCVPLLDTIEIPQNGQKLKLMVMPFLRPFNDPNFQTFGEFVAFFTQICEVRSFKHPRVVTNQFRLITRSGSPIHARAEHCTQVRMVA